MDNKDVFGDASNILDEYEKLNSKASVVFDELLLEMLSCAIVLSKRMYSVRLSITVASNGNHSVELDSNGSILTEGGRQKSSSIWYSISRDEPKIVENAILTSSMMKKIMKVVSQGNLTRYGMSLLFNDGKLRINAVDSVMEDKFHSMVEALMVGSKILDKKASTKRSRL